MNHGLCIGCKFCARAGLSACHTRKPSRLSRNLLPGSSGHPAAALFLLRRFDARQLPQQELRQKQNRNVFGAERVTLSAVAAPGADHRAQCAFNIRQMRCSTGARHHQRHGTYEIKAGSALEQGTSLIACTTTRAAAEMMRVSPVRGGGRGQAFVHVVFAETLQFEALSPWPEFGRKMNPSMPSQVELRVQPFAIPNTHAHFIPRPRPQKGAFRQNAGMRHPGHRTTYKQGANQRTHRLGGITATSRSGLLTWLSESACTGFEKTMRTGAAPTSFAGTRLASGESFQMFVIHSGETRPNHVTPALPSGPSLEDGFSTQGAYFDDSYCP